MEKSKRTSKERCQGIEAGKVPPCFLLLDYFWTDLCRSREHGYRGRSKIILSEIGAVYFLCQDPDQYFEVYGNNVVQVST